MRNRILAITWGLLSFLLCAYDQPRPTVPNALNPDAPKQVIYEVQVRTANAVYKGAGSPEQQAQGNVLTQLGNTCEAALSKDRFTMGTLEDLLKPTQDYHQGITLDYIKNRVHASMLWLMPLFPNNSKWALPSPMDNLGSPYAVRDYMHASGLISAEAVKTGRNEFSPEEKGLPPAWGDSSFDAVMKKAQSIDLKVMLDVAFNHFGHNYMFYDYSNGVSIRDRLKSGKNLDDLWKYEDTFDPALVHPEILDTPEKLEALANSDAKVKTDLEEFKKRAPKLQGDELVRGFNMWRVMTDSERARYNPDAPNYLEYQVPGFYRGKDTQPSKGVGDNFTNNWGDVKFLYHHEMHGWDWVRGDYYEQFVRNREYLFRVLNYWVSKGVRGFRLDHTTDFDSGMGPNEWKYIIGKVNYYDWVRQGRPANHVPPIYLAEEFNDQLGMSMVTDIMTDGYVGDIRGRDGAVKDTSYIEAQLEKEGRFQGHTLVMRALETHDEHRLFEGTGFDIWSGAAFYAIGASSHGTPMMLMGQEFGEPWGLSFRGEDFIRGRFYGESNHNPNGEDLTNFYGKINQARLDWRNRAIWSPNHYYLRLKGSAGIDQRVFAQVKWDHSQGPNVIFTFVKPWDSGTPYEDHYFIPPELAQELLIHDDYRYKLVNAFTNQQEGDCMSGANLKWDLRIMMNGYDRVRWLRLESCQ